MDTKTWYRITINAFYFIEGLVFASWASRIPEIKDMLGMNDALFGGVLFFLSLGEICSMFPAGYLIGRFGSKPVLIFSILLYSLILVLIGMATSPLQLSVILILFGIAGNLCNISLNTQAIGVERLYQRSLMGFFHGLWSLAGFAGGLIGALMAAFNILPFIHFFIIFVLAAGVIILLKGTTLPHDRKMGNLEERIYKAYARPNTYIFLVGLMAMSCAICEGIVFDWTNIYFDDVLHAPKDLIRLGYITAMGSMTLVRFTVDRFIIRYGAIRVLFFTGFMLIAGMFFIVGCQNFIASTFGFLLIGAGMSPVIPICYSLAGHSKNMLSGIAITTVSSIGFLGLMVGPPIVGFISHAIGLRWALCIIAVVGIFILLLAHALKIQNKKFEH
jgi:MFS family permease